jgi:hypothetical protein
VLESLNFLYSLVAKCQIDLISKLTMNLIGLNDFGTSLTASHQSF